MGGGIFSKLLIILRIMTMEEMQGGKGDKGAGVPAGSSTLGDELMSPCVWHVPLCVGR